MAPPINDKIRRGFSNSARQYDLYSGLHREIADDLLTKIIKEPGPSALLDVGCGTGYLTSQARKQYPGCNIIGLDFAQGMLDVARAKHENIAWILADGDHLPFSSGCFDHVISNLAYQWAQDLAQAFSEARRVLTDDGVLTCTLFGRHTCHELFQSLQEASEGALQFVRLPDQVKIREALIAAGFEDPIVDGKQVRIEFKDMYELMAWFKFIGAPHLPREGYLGPELLSRAALIYQDKFSYQKGVGASFEVIGVYAKK